MPLSHRHHRVLREQSQYIKSRWPSSGVGCLAGAHSITAAVATRLNWEVWGLAVLECRGSTPAEPFSICVVSPISMVSTAKFVAGLPLASWAREVSGCKIQTEFI